MSSEAEFSFSFLLSVLLDRNNNDDNNNKKKNDDCLQLMCFTEMRKDN